MSFNYKMKWNLEEKCSQVIQKLDMLQKQVIKKNRMMLPCNHRVFYLVFLQESSQCGFSLHMYLFGLLLSSLFLSYYFWVSVQLTLCYFTEKIWKLETLLRKCKESIRRNKERISQLSMENQQLQQTLTDTKVSRTWSYMAELGIVEFNGYRMV